MHRYLVVGCGGSGGATLRFLMDQLKADLAANGVPALPAAWQFVHLDVPIAPDSGPGLLGSVRDQGGTYTSLSRTGANYTAFSAAVDGRFRRKSACNALASWWPDPSQVSVPIQSGAGQFRAVGRVLTLAAASTEIKPALDAAWTRLQAAEVNREMQSIVGRAPGLGDADPASPPVILVVSSMAGGSGASMVLDVARLLSMIEGVDPGLIAMFLYSPDVFLGLDKSHRTGVEANGAAALAELIAAQATASDDDESAIPADDPFAALGMVGRAQRRSFGRVFPVGSRIGFGGAVLGDGQPDTIYRALGRGLAALMMAGQATKGFVDYDLTNKGGVEAHREQFGWGLRDPSHVAWGSFGFSSLSLGRDRYVEYAAQRLARLAVDRLAEGHLQRDDERMGTEQVAALVTQQVNRFLGRAGLAEVGRPAKNWFPTVALPRPELDTMADSIAKAGVDPFIVGEHAGANIGGWLTSVNQRLYQQGPALHGEIDRAATRWAEGWHTQLAARLEEGTAEAIATYGLPYAVGLLERSRRDVDRLAGELRAVAAPPTQIRLPAQQQQQVDQLMRVKGSIHHVDAVVQELHRGYRASIAEELRNRAAMIVSDVLLSLTEGMLLPLEFACRSALSDVQHARESMVETVGIAHLRTDDYAAWPKDGEELVPERFAHAENEVLLTTASDFPEEFGAHLQAQDPSLRPEDVKARCAHHIIRGKWDTVAGEKPKGDLIETLASWRPAATSDGAIQGRARYVVHTATPEILQRSRLFVNRPQQPFSDYARESLYDFVLARGLPDGQRRQREDAVVHRFRQALQLARPIVGVSDEAVAFVHGPQADQRQYKFGPVPFEGLPIALRLRGVLGDNAENIAQAAAERLDQALASDSPATRIDIFGSYSSYFPVVYTSFLQPIAARWAATEDQNRGQFWQWRRARPLPDALPMGQAQRRALVGGWLIGRLTGQVTVPDDIGLPGAGAVRVWDSTTGSWLAFPNPLVVPRSSMRTHADALAAVLESMVIALAACHDSKDQGPLRPYTALRRLFDDGVSGPTTGMGDRPVGARHVARWLQDGASRSGASILDPPSGSAADATAEQRLALLTDWARSTRQQYVELWRQHSATIRADRLLALDLADDYVWAVAQIEDFARNRVALPDPGPDPVRWNQGPNT